MQDFLDGSHPVEEIAQRFYDKPFFLYLGRPSGCRSRSRARSS